VKFNWLLGKKKINGKTYEEWRDDAILNTIKNAEKLLEDAKRLGLSEDKLRNAKSHFQSKSYENALNDANDFEREVKNAFEEEKINQK
jgi:hypothetical protein